MTKSLSKAIALATLVGATASAHAVSVNPQGLGEVLLYSLYTAEEGNITNINITNTTNLAKAVKVRFVEGQNSQEVLDFNLYLSPRDQWSGAVTTTTTPDGVGAMLITADKSCTAPVIPSAGVAFKNDDYLGDGGAQSLARTLVGHLEVIEMGTLTGEMAKAVKAGSAPGLAPADCGAITQAFGKDGIWAEGEELNAPAAEMVNSTETAGGLYGSASILNIDGSTQISYDAVAIQDFKLDKQTLHARPGTIYPTLNGAVAPNDEIERTTFVPAVTTDPSAPRKSTVELITESLAVASIHNDFVLDKERGSQTNWVITYPTKRFHVDANMPDSLAAVAAKNLSDLKADLAAELAKDKDANVTDLEASIVKAEAAVKTALSPFQSNWDRVEGKSCDRISINAWDNEEYVETKLQFSPSGPGDVSELCYETNILTFNDAKVLGGEFVSYNINLKQPDFQFGWMDIDFVKYGEVGSKGLPAIGFSAVTVKNDFTGNGLANNYGSVTSHKATKATDTP